MSPAIFVYAQVMRVCLLAAALFAGACRPAAPTVTPASPIVDDIRLEGFDVLPPDARAAIPLRTGVRLTDEAEKAAGERAVEVFQNHGYPYAQVSVARESDGAGRVRVTITAEPGARGYFGRIDISGHRTVDDRIIRRRVMYAPGDLFRRTAIEATQQRIGALGLFKSVQVQVEKVEGGGPVDVPTLITVEERTPWHWNLGLGYAAGEELAVDARVSHLNFLGSARRLDLEGRLSAIERDAGIALTQADSWHRSLSLSLAVRHRELDERSFFVLSRGGQAAATWQWTSRFASTFSYAVARERSRVSSSLAPLAVLQDGMLSAWSVDLDRHVAVRPSGRATGAANNAPAHTMALHLEQAGGWMHGTFDYVNLIGDVRRYHRFEHNGIVVASRIRYGSIDPLAGEADIPLLKRFFLGGANEMRGWGVYELSPVSASGEPVGGKSMFTATGELRIPIFRRLTGALFVEAGNVWQDAWTMRPADLVYDAGPGVRINTPFGLIRLDAGFQLKTVDGLLIDGEPQKHRWRINVGIGEAF